MSLKILFINSPKYDYLTATVIEGFLDIRDELDLDFFCTKQGNYAKDGVVLEKKHALEFGSGANIIFVGTNMSVDLALFRELRERNKKALFVCIDGADAGELTYNPFLFDLYFKREYYQKERLYPNIYNSMLLAKKPHLSLWKPHLKAHPLFPFPHIHSSLNKSNIRTLAKNLFYHFSPAKVFPLPFGIEKRVFTKDLEAKREMRFVAVITPQLESRQWLLEYLKELQLPHSFIGQIPPTKQEVMEANRYCLSGPEVSHLGGGGVCHNVRYYDLLRNSFSALSIPGAGFDTFRFWEILGSGCLLISKRVPIRMPFPLQEGIHYLAFDTKDELNNILANLYKNREALESIRRQGYEFARSYHTTRARAFYMLNVLSLFL